MKRVDKSYTPATDPTGVHPSLRRFYFPSEDTPFKEFADEPNPFTNKETAKIFSQVIRKLNDFAIHCSYLEYPLGDKKEIKDQLVSLREELKEIHNDLKDMIPKEATKKKEGDLIRFFKVSPLLLNFFVNDIVHDLGKYLDPQYPRSKLPKKKGDIRRYWKDAYKKPYPQRIYMDDRTKTTIAISILAYQWGCPFRKLYDIYNKANKQRNIWLRQFEKARAKSLK